MTSISSPTVPDLSNFYAASRGPAPVTFGAAVRSADKVAVSVVTRHARGEYVGDTVRTHVNNQDLFIQPTISEVRRLHQLKHKRVLVKFQSLNAYYAESCWQGAEWVIKTLARYPLVMRPGTNNLSQNAYRMWVRVDYAELLVQAIPSMSNVRRHEGMLHRDVNMYDPLQILAAAAVEDEARGFCNGR